MRLNVVKAIFIKELKELRRDRIGRAVVFIVPVAIMLILGFGLAIDVEHLPFSVLDEDRSKTSRELIYRFVENERYFNFFGFSGSVREMERAIRKNKIRFGIVIPPNFERKLYRQGKSEIQVLIDGVFPYRALVSKVYAEAITNSFNLDINSKGIKGNTPVSVETRYWFNEELKQKYLTASGTLAIILAISPAILASLLIVKEKERGSIYNIFTSSVTKLEFLFAKQVFVFIISLVNLFIMFFLTVVIFRVPFKGNFALFFISSVIFIFVSTSVGLLMSVFVKRQVTAVVGTLLVTVIPAFLYSGYITPVSSMKKEAFIEAHLFPYYYYLKIVKGCYLKAAGVSYLFPDILALLAFYLLLFGLTFKLFKKREV